ncbi:MAG: glycosyltransferase family 4 protein [Phycisphaerae bacterium]|nr:glycosyltransferase family 4 protein [Phycisphaerae bacterium]
MDQRIHTAFFDFVTHFGGAPRTTVSLAARLLPRVDVTMVDPYGCCEPYVQAIQQAGITHRVLCPQATTHVVGGQGSRVLRLWRVAKSLPGLLTVRRRLAEVMEELSPSLIFCSSFKAASVVGMNRRIRHIPLVIYLQGWYTPDMMPWYGRRLCRRRCRAILAVSRATRAAAACSGIDPRKTYVLHNAIDVEEITALANRPLEAPLPQDHRPVRILCLGAIVRTKGQHTAVEAMRHVLDAGHDAVLWIAGEFSPYGPNKHYLRDTQALAERLGVSDRVVWLHLRHDLPQVMKAATVVVLPTHTEGHPRALLEAMALGKPVAACPVGGIMDMIAPNLTGLYFDVEDPAGLAACVDCFVRDPQGAQRMGLTAQEYIRRSFTPAQQIRDLIQILQRVAHGDDPSPRPGGA